MSGREPLPVREGSAPEPERVIASLRPHGRAMFWPSVAFVAVSFGVAYFAESFDQSWQNIAVAVAGALLIILLWLIPMLSWLARRYVITNRRIVVRHGLIVRTRHELMHSRGYDITLRQGAFQRIVRSGDVFISNGPDRPVVLADSPAAILVLSTLHDLAERSLNPIAARRQAEQSTAGNQPDTW